MHIATQIQIMDEAICTSHSANNLEKGKNPIIILLAMSE